MITESNAASWNSERMSRSRLRRLALPCRSWMVNMYVFLGTFETDWRG
jgi:hypothetical protein